MTLPSRARALATIALLAAAAPAHAVTTDDGRLTPTATAAAPRGVFEVVLQADGAAPVPAKILVEERAGRVEATLILDQRVSAMRVMKSDAQSLQASISTTDGAGQLTLRLDGDAIDGTLKAKKREWKVSGVRSL
jgi:hypothetical protein